jgi:ubiquinone/menaquinone biosynthesis C-methylase UbiE
MNSAMRKPIYVHPGDLSALTIQAESEAGGDVREGQLLGRHGERFAIARGIPDLTWPQRLDGAQLAAQRYYGDAAGIYDDVAHLSFTIQKQDEVATRRSFVDYLSLEPDSKVLELACGTGRDSVNLADALDERGELYAQDLSPAMLDKCREKLSGRRPLIELSVGNACALPFPAGYFDAVFSFGGLGVFGDIKQSLREMVRVARPGAKIVVGDESLGPWLTESEYGRILLNNNPLFKNQVPLGDLPVEARNVTLRWVVGGVYYLIEFVVGVGEPDADFDLPIPGRRGGTLRTRYQGRLEGVSPETLDLAQKARDKSGRSMHDWLEEVVKAAALAQLEEGRK